MFHEGKSPVSGPNNSHTHSTNTECQYTAGTVLGAGGRGGQDRKALCSWSSYSSGRDHHKNTAEDHCHEEKRIMTEPVSEAQVSLE